jgi:SAM-dependent methyltransferase
VILSRNIAGERDVEWSWVAANLPQGPGEALDFGCGTSNLGLIAALRGFKVTRVDLEEAYWHYTYPGLELMLGDILELPLVDDFFDLVINCSSVEHVGLVGRYSVKEANLDGDLQAMARMRDLMKRGALMLCTMPVGKDAVFSPLHRVFGRRRLPLLLDGFDVLSELFWVKDEANKWVTCDKDTALGFAPESTGEETVEGNSYALGCMVLKKS